VATLARAPGERCGGVAYRLPDADATATLAALDVREQGGYERVALPVALVGTPQREVIAVTWIASHDNPFHLGATPFPEMAREIRAASGPSGSNLEYVLALHDALAALGFSDPHVEAVVAALGASTRE
jgi:cation transport regulator ChaC